MNALPRVTMPTSRPRQCLCIQVLSGTKCLPLLEQIRIITTSLYHTTSSTTPEGTKLQQLARLNLTTIRFVLNIKYNYNIYLIIQGLIQYYPSTQRGSAWFLTHKAQVRALCPPPKRCYWIKVPLTQVLRQVCEVDFRRYKHADRAQTITNRRWWTARNKSFDRTV